MDTKPYIERERFLRLKQVLEIFPVSSSTWWAGVKDKKFPQPIRICSRITVWKASEIFQMIKEMSNDQDIN